LGDRVTDERIILKYIYITEMDARVRIRFNGLRIGTSRELL
jgi:hypothetical protein